MAVTNNFSPSTLDLNDKIGLSQPTALVWGPDGRLYVTEVNGNVKVLTVAFGDKTPGDGDATASFYVTEAITLSAVKAIQNHNDNGTKNALTNRQVTGIDVTPQFDAEGKPVLFDGKPAVTLYVTSSDSRIGAGGGGADAGLDTNSGVITKLTQTGPNSWTAVDLVRGFPRSEENHALNGLEVIQELDAQGNLVSERLIVASGGNANSGAPSNNFAGQQEQPLSAAILEVDLDMLKAMDVKIDAEGRAYVYDLPTLDDPTRAGEPDATDPWGGNDGLNSAKLLDGGPVRMYSPGYRNAYDVEVTEDGRVFTYDNGANGTWGGRPIGEAGDNKGTTDFAQALNYIATNLNNGDGNANDPINLVNWKPSNKDQFHEVTRSDDLDGRQLSAGQGGAATYTDPASGHTLVYGGHPNPTRAEGSRAGLLFSPKGGADDAFLLVSNQDSFGNGGGSDYDEVVAWFAEVEADNQKYPGDPSSGTNIYGANPGDLTKKVLAVEPGVLYDVYAFSDGSGAVVPTGGAAPQRLVGGVGETGAFLGKAGLPSDIAEIVARPNPIEGDYREAGKTDGSVDTGNGSINGLTEYTSTVLDGGGVKMSGAIVAASLGGSLIVMGRDANGVVQSGVNSQGFSVADDRTVIAAGGAPLGLASLGDDYLDRGLSKAFQGSIWSAVYKQNGPLIEIFQPKGVGIPLAGSELIDPTDKDGDGIDYLDDPFEFSAENGYALAAGQSLVLDFSPLNDAFPTSFSSTGLLGAALDGVTPNQDAQTAAENFPEDQQRPGLFDNEGNLIPGGNAPIFQIKNVADGSAVGAGNTARDAMHTGIRPDADVQRLVSTITVKNWVPEAGVPQTGQLTGLMFGDGTQSNFLRVVFGGVEGVGAGLEVGFELGDAGYTPLARVPLPLADVMIQNVELRLEISDLGGDFDVAVFYRLTGEEQFTEVPLNGGAGFQLPAGVLRDVLTGDHTISSGGTTLPSGAAVGLVAEDVAGGNLANVDFLQLEIRGFGNEIYADTAAEVGKTGTAGVDTVIYTGTATNLAPLAANVENFDGRGSAASYSLSANNLDNTILVGEGANTIATGGGADTVRGTLEQLDGDHITDFSQADQVIVEGVKAADATVTYAEGSAVVTINGASIQFSGPDLDGFTADQGPTRFLVEDVTGGLRIALVPDETVVYRVNAGSNAAETAGAGTIAAIDGGPDWVGDATLIGSTGPARLLGETDYVYGANDTDTEAEVTYADGVDPAEVPWQLFVNERSDNLNDAEKLTYEFEVVAGATYRIDLLYTENWNGIFNNQTREFDVSVEGAVPSSFDNINPVQEIAAALNLPVPTGASSAAEKGAFLGTTLMRSHTLTAGDDVLSLQFEHGLQNPKINAIQITRVGPLPTDTNPPVVVSITVENPPSVQDDAREVTVVLSDTRGFDAALLGALDGSELAFSGIVPQTVSAPVVAVSGDGLTATLTYTITPPETGWPTGEGSIAIAEGAYTDAAGNGSAAATADFVFDPNAGGTTPTISVGDASAAEGGEALVTFTREGNLDEAVDVTFVVVPGTASEADYDAPETTTVTIPAGSASVSLAIPVVDDEAAEGAETFSVTITGVSAGAEIGQATGTVTIAASDAGTGVPEGGALFDLDFETAGGPLSEGGFETLLGGSGALEAAKASVEGGKLVVVTSDGDLSETPATASKNDFVRAADLSAPAIETAYLSTRFDNPFDAEFMAARGYGQTVPNYLQQGIVIATGDAATNQNPGQAMKLIWGGNGGTAVQLWSQGAIDQKATVAAMSSAAVAAGKPAFGTTDVASVELVMGVDKAAGTVSAYVTLLDAAGAVLGGVRPVATPGFASVAPQTIPPAIAAAIANGTSVAGVTSNDYDQAAGDAEASFTATWDQLTLTSPQVADGPGEEPSGDAFKGLDLADLSDDPAAPTNLGTLALGDSTLQATQQGPNAEGGRDYDYVTFTVAEGQVLQGLTLDGYQSSDLANQGFLALIEGATMPAPPTTQAEYEAVAAQLLGGTLIGGSAGITPGNDLLGEAALGSGEVQGQTTLDFDAPLPAGTYTLWFSQGGASSTTTLTFQTAEAPSVPTLSIADAPTVTETGDNGDTALLFPLALSDGFTGEASVTFEVDGASFTETVAFANGAGTLSVAVPNDDADTGDTSLSVTITGAAAGGEALALGTATASGTVAEDDAETGGGEPGAVVFALNVGGGAVTGADGTQYEADTGAGWTGSKTYTDGGAGQPALAGGDYDRDGVTNGDDTPYQTERYGGAPGTAPMVFTKTGLPAGDYLLTLKFAELFNVNLADNARVFSVVANGQEVVTELDLFDVVDEADKAYDVTVPVTVGADGVLALSFTATADNAKIGAIVLREAASVEPGNSAPTAAPIDAGTVAEDGEPVAIDLLQGATDADGDALSVQNVAVTDADGNVVAFTLDGATLTIDPAVLANVVGAGETTSVTVAYEVIDGQGGATPNTATLTVEGVEDGTVWYLDADGDGFGTVDDTLTQVAQPDGYVDQAGDPNDDNATVYPGAPEINDGLDNDGDGETDEDNTAPTVTGETATVASDAALTFTAAELLANDADADGDALSVTAVGGAVGGTVTLAEGVVTFTPAEGFTGAASFAYTVSDGFGGATEGTVSVTVTDPGTGGGTDETVTPVVFSAGALSSYGNEDAAPGAGFEIGDEGASLRLQGNAWKKIALPEGLAITDDTVLRFDLTILGSAGEILGIALETDQNFRTDGDAFFQLAGRQNFSTYASREFFGQAGAVGETVTYEIPLAALAGRTDLAHLVFIGDDDRDAAIDARFGNVAFVEPGEGDGGTGGGETAAPEIFGGAIPDVELAQGAALEVELPFVDADTAREDLVFTFEGLPGFVSEAGGLLTGTPGNADVGAYTVAVTATDPEGNATTGTFEITVTDVNDAPVVEGALPDRSAVLGASVSLALPQGVFVDVDQGDVLAYSATGLPAGLSIDPATGAITGAPSAAGSFEITVTATDLAGASVSTGFTFDVAAGPPREAVVIEAESFTGLGESAFFAGFASTASGNQLIRLPQGQTGAVATDLDSKGMVPGFYDLTVRAYDEADGASPLRVLLDRGDGSAPALLGEFVLDRTGLPGQGNAAQAGNIVELTIPGVDVPSGARLVLEGTADAGEFLRIDLVRFMPVDAPSDAAPGFVSPAAFAADENGTVVGTVAATDPEGEAVSYAIAGGADAALFAIDETTGALSFVSAPDFEAPADAGGDNAYEVVVEASDGTQTAQQAVTVTVGDANDAPEAAANPPAQEATEDEAVSIALAALFSDQDGDALAYSLVGGAPAGLSIADGALTGTPTEAGTFTVTVEASDGEATARTSFSLTVAEATGGGDTGGGTAGGLAPTDDLDGDGTPNASDTDADGDGAANAADSFAYDAQGGRLLGAGETIDLTFGTNGTPYQNGFTGLLQAGIKGSSALKAFNEETGTARVEDGKLIVVASNGDTGTSNNPEDDYQLGVKNRAFTVESRVENPFQDGSGNFEQLGIHVGVDSTDFAKLVFGFAAGTVEFSARVDDVESKATGANQPLPGGLSLAGFAAVDLRLEVEAVSATQATIKGFGTFLDANGNPIAGAAEASFGSITVGGALAAALWDEGVGVGAGVTQTQVGNPDAPFDAVYDRFTVTEGVGSDTGGGDGGDPGDGDGDGGTGGGQAPTNAAEAFAAQGDLDTAQSYGSTVVGAAKLEILTGANDIDISNFGNSSFKVTNLGDKKISAIFIDVTSALYPDSVFDPDGKGGDSVTKAWAVNSAGGTGGYVSGTGYFLPGPDPLPNTTGTGMASNGGFKGAMVKFDPNNSGGFQKGEVVGFSGDMDPNSIAGLTKASVDAGAVSAWDVGGISGHELIGSAFTVLFDDGTTATGDLMSDKSASGSHALATQGAGATAPGLTVGGVAAGGTGTYGVTAPSVIVTGEPGQTVRVTLTKGLDPVTNETGGIDDLVEARLGRYDFKVSNNFDSQSVDVTIGANGTFDATALFDYANAPANNKAGFAGDKVAPLGFVAAVIDPATGLATSPVTAPVYLANQGGPVQGGGSGGGEEPEGYWLAANGALKVQFEDIMGGANPPTGWGYEAPGQGNAGAQGGHYYWGSESGSTGVNNQANAGIFGTQFLIEEAGLYTLRSRWVRDTNDPTDARNDIWVRVDGDTAALMPSGSDPLIKSNGFVKLYGTGNTSTSWRYAQNFDDSTDDRNPASRIFLDEGLHTIEFAGRSQGFHIDFFELTRSTSALGLSTPNSSFVVPGDTGGDTGGGDTGGDTGGGDTGGDTGGGGTGGGTGGTTERVFKVKASADDWELFGNATSSDLEFGFNGADPQTVGIRFDDVVIPQGAVIERAYLRFEAIDSGSNAASFLIEIENTENAKTYSSSSKPDARSYAEDDFVWSNVQAWTAGQTYETPDLKALIEAVVGADGVADGALAFRISGAPGNAGDRAAHAWNSSTGDEPELVIEFASDSLL